MIMNVQVFEIVPIKPNIIRSHVVVTSNDGKPVSYEIALNISDFVKDLGDNHLEINEESLMRAITKVIADTRQTAEIAAILSEANLSWNIEANLDEIKEKEVNAPEGYQVAYGESNNSV